MEYGQNRHESSTKSTLEENGNDTVVALNRYRMHMKSTQKETGLGNDTELTHKLHTVNTHLT